MFENFEGNQPVAAALSQMIRQQRIPQALLLHGPEGVGKATLARRFAARLLGGAERIEQDDLSLPHNAALIAEREKLASDKRAEEPLLFGSNPDFLTFPPEGPLRQISIQQMRLLKEHSRFTPLRGAWRVFLIDQIDRANDQAQNSLLKTLEEPPEHLILILTAQNAFDLLPTIRSRSVHFQLSPLSDDDMRAFVRRLALDDAERRVSLAGGSPGLAISMDLEAYDRRREAMLTLLEAAAGRIPFSDWAGHAERISAARSEKLDSYLLVLYGLLEDLLLLSHGLTGIRNRDVAGRLEKLARSARFEWLRAAVRRVDELAHFTRRNIQKTIALDALVLELRAA